MNLIFRKFLFALFFPLALFANDRADRTIILDKAGVKNLGIAFALAEESDFEKTFFAIGRLEEAPENHAVLASRIPGRVAEIMVQPGAMVTAGQELVRIESRQPGDPPPSITLKSPIDGLVSESHVRLGEPVEPSNELLDILDLRQMLAVARVPEHDAAILEAGKTTARIRVAALGDQILTGTLLRLGTSADRESGSIDAVFRVDNPDLRLRPGMRAEFSIASSVRKNVLAIPREALHGDPANRVVYVKDFDLPNAFIRTPVQTGARNEEYVEIENGLFPGDEVVTTGSYLLGFSGGGGISLKAALDAAHGHEHNEDGSEITDAKRSAASPADAAQAASGPSLLTLFFASTSAILLVLLIFTRRRSS